LIDYMRCLSLLLGTKNKIMKEVNNPQLAS